MSSLRQQRFTPEQYIEMERAADYRSEYLHGEIFAMAGASFEHNLIVANVFARLYAALDDGPCRVMANDMRVQVVKSGLYTYPDIVVVCGQPKFADTTMDTLLNPIVIVEVLSPSTELFDRGEKFAYYQNLPSLTDYILIAQDKKRIEHFSRQGTQWILTVADTSAAIIQLASVSSTLSVSSLYKNVDFAIEPDL